MAPRAEDDRSEDGSAGIPDWGDAIDAATFEQILEMDDDSDRDFSRSIVFGFFDQAATTFDDMEEALKEEDLMKLSSLGHFLKGSSATLGLTKVKDHCEKIQNYGLGRDETGDREEADPRKSLSQIEALLPIVKRDYEDAKKRLISFYGTAPGED